MTTVKYKVGSDFQLLEHKNRKGGCRHHWARSNIRPHQLQFCQLFDSFGVDTILYDNFIGFSIYVGFSSI